MRGDERPIRFWAFAANPFIPRRAPNLARHDRFLAERRVDLTAFLARPFGCTAQSPDMDADPRAALPRSRPRFPARSMYVLLD